MSGGKVPSPRTELLHNINPACGKGYVNPNAALRVGEWKLLVECWNVTTQEATGKVELFHIVDDPYECEPPLTLSWTSGTRLSATPPQDEGPLRVGAGAAQDDADTHGGVRCLQRPGAADDLLALRRRGEGRGSVSIRRPLALFVPVVRVSARLRVAGGTTSAPSASTVGRCPARRGTTSILGATT